MRIVWTLYGGRRGGFYIRPLGTRTCRGVGDAAPYTSYMGDVGANSVRPCSLAVTQDSTGAYRMLPYAVGADSISARGVWP